MKKRFLLFSFIICALSGFAQPILHDKAMELVKKNSVALGLTTTDLANSFISNAYDIAGTGITMIYLQQSHLGIPVKNQVKVMAFQNGAVASNKGTWIKSMELKAGNQSATPAVSASRAVKTALAAKKIFLADQPYPQDPADPHKINFGKPARVNEDITATLTWVPLKDNNQARLAWEIFLAPINTPDYWLLSIDAFDNKLINETNLTISCNWDNNAKKGLVFADKMNKTDVAGTPLFDFSRVIQQQQSASSPSIVNSASYQVIPFPAESPKHEGGFPALRTNPWTAASGNATSLKWHSNGVTDFNITRGNNVWATEDRSGTNSPIGLPATSTSVADPLNFNFTPNFGTDATQRSPVANQQFNTTNLFYWNNIMHDLMYQYGFDEVAGNFQENNQGRGGIGNDYVLADAQDGSGNNNANFATPADGGRPRMQMYLWDTASTLAVNSPASIQGIYTCLESRFSTANKLISNGPVTGQLIFYNDNAAGSTHEACTPPANNITGKIALANRGTCNFTSKVKNAQNAGAIGVIVINNAAGDPISMGGDDNTISIPAIMVSQADGATLISALSANINVTLGTAVVDADLDNGVIAHEFAHGISTRLTGGPAQANCLFNAEGMGEGISDYYALMVTQNWAFSNLTDGFNNPRAMGTYAFGQSPSMNGIRSQKYCTDFTVNSKVYASSIPAESHDRGEIWCATLWDMTWNIINQVGSINPDLFNPAAGGGNTIALKLVTQGMKLQPCSPGFIDARDAILQADQLLYGGTFSCAIKEAFRRRGMGAAASQGSSNSVNDQVPDFSPSLKIKLTQNVTEIPEGQNITYTNTVSTCSPVSNHVIRDTLPLNVTYLSGGTYNAATRVVSFPVNLGAGQTQTYSFTVTVNNGSYFTASNLFSENVAGTTIPASLTASSTTGSVWTVSTAQSHSAPNSFFTPNSAVPSTQILTTTNPLALGPNQSQLSFWHAYNTEPGFDGGVIEISTDNAVTWVDLGNKIILNKYPVTIDATSGTQLAGRQAYTGSSAGFVKTTVNLSAYTGQNAKFRWYFNSDNGTAGVGWNLDDILVRSEPAVYMRSSLFLGGTRLDYSDTVTMITTAACVPVSITVQPVNVNACAGADAVFSVTAAGTTPAYQWQVSNNNGGNYTNMTGQTAATLTLAAVTGVMNNNLYRVIISNACPSTITSAALSLLVSTPASIATQPGNTTVCAGTTATFAVSAAGSANSYQWQGSSDGGTSFVNLVGQTSPTLLLNGTTQGMNNNQYRVVISSCSPTALNSLAAILTVNAPASITSQPQHTTACTGSNASFNVVSPGTNVNYQWQVSSNGGSSYSDIPGQNSATLLLANVSLSMSNNLYRVLVGNLCSTVPITSLGAALTVTNSAAITTQPLSAITCAGSNASFVASASGVSYQWQVSTDGGTSFNDIPGATATTMNLPAVTAVMNNNKYKLVVTSCSPTSLNSNIVTLTVNSAAGITAQPLNQKKCVGENASFSVAASGSSLAYQWQASTDGGVTYTNIPGETNAALNLSSVNPALNNNLYRVILNTAAPCGQVISASAALTVNALPAVGSTTATISPVCPGSMVILNGTGASTYNWSNGISNGVSFPALATTTFTVTGTDLNNCINSSTITITVLPLPSVSIIAAPFTSLAPGSSTTISATSNPPSTLFNWMKDGILIPGSNASSITVDASGQGNYSASFTDGNGCTGISNVITIRDSVPNIAFIYPNPNNGHFFVSYYSPGINSQKRTLVLYDSKGAKVYSKEYVISTSAQKMEVNISNLSAGIYMVQLFDEKGNRLAKGKVKTL